MISYFGVSGYGRVLVPVNYRLSADEVSYIVEHSGSTVLLVDPEIDEALSGVTAKERIVLDGADDAELFAPAPEGAQPAPWVPDEDATCTINYTSGTTARPKGVQLTHRTCWLNATSFGWHTTVTDRDVLLHTLPMFHANGWGMPYAVTAMGGTHVVIRKIDGEEILRRVEREGVTLMCGAPAVVASILDAAAARAADGPADPRPRPGPDRGGGRAAAERHHRPGRGAARLGVHPDLRPHRDVAAADRQPGPPRLGRPAGRRAGPAAIAARACPRSASGCGPTPTARCSPAPTTSSPATGSSPRSRRRRCVDGWFHTGDGGYLDGAVLSITDRKKDVIITGGENVSSIEVEDCLYQHPAVAEAAVIGVPDDKWGETIKALVVLRPGMSAEPAELIEFCRARMTHYKCPTTVELRSALERTATGKLQKFKLRAPYWQDRERKVN